jgi:hypothetical protein
MSKNYEDKTSTKHIIEGEVILHSPFNNSRYAKVKFERSSDENGIFLNVNDGPVWVDEVDAILLAKKILEAFV